MKKMLMLLFLNSILVAGGEERSVSEARPSAKSMTAESEDPNESTCSSNPDCSDACLKSLSEFPGTIIGVPICCCSLICALALHKLEQLRNKKSSHTD